MKDLARRRSRIVRIEAKRPSSVSALVEHVELEVDPGRRRRVGAALLRLLNSPGTPDDGR